MDARRRFSVWTVVAPLALVGIAAVAVLLVLGALHAPRAPRAQAAATTAAAPVIDASVPPTYRVRKGDTLSSIAERYGLTTDWILSLNPQLDPMSLTIGDRINLRQPAAP